MLRLNQNKPIAIYGKKPRGSKTSKRESFNGIPVFLHYSSSVTAGNIVCYYDKPPYPRICVSCGKTYWDCRDKIEEFFSKNALAIKDKLENLDKNFCIPYDIFDKNLSVKNQEYEIFTGDNFDRNFLRLVTPFYNGEYLYLWVDPNVAPAKNSGGKKIIDTEKVLEDYLKRKE